MNPFEWRTEHRAAIILGAILGAVILLVIGFMYRGLNYGTISSALFWSPSTVRWADPRRTNRRLLSLRAAAFAAVNLALSQYAELRRASN